MGNTLYYGDNLNILRHYISDESVDLVYLDPPFNSKATYNVLFKEHSGAESQAQMTAFEDTWHWKPETEKAFLEIIDTAPASVVEMMSSFRKFVGLNDMMAYLTMMCIRLIELRRILKPTGSIFLHCDPTASHYLKILMDTIFGKFNFRNEIIWKRAETVKGNVGQGTKFFDRNTDTILFYAKADDNKFTPQFKEYTQKYIDSFYKHIEPNTGRRYQLISMTGPGGASKGNPYYEVMGVKRYWRYSKKKMQELIAAGLVVQTSPGTVPRRKQYLDEGKGVPLQSLWEDVPALHSQDSERLGYPTQKPEALLERIIKAATDEGDIVLDPFCGCGTTISTAQKLYRHWIGIDVTHLAINLIKNRLKDAYQLEARKDYTVVGEPEDLDGARALATLDRFQFQWWATSLIGARAYGDKKKGADTGIDGLAFFMDGTETKKVIVSVKSGKVSVRDIRDLGHVIEREDAAMGIFITLAPPTGPMIKEAAGKGIYKHGVTGRTYSAIQMLTIEEIFAGKKPDMPEHHALPAYKKAQRAKPTSEKLNF